MHNTMLNLIDAAQDLVTHATQPTFTPAIAETLVRNLEQRIDEAGKILRVFPSREVVNHLVDVVGAQLAAAEQMVKVIRDIKGDIEAHRFLNEMIVLGQGINALSECAMVDEIAGAERLMNHNSH